MRAESTYDVSLVLVTLLLVICGLVMLYSASSILAMERYGDAYFFVKRQAAFALVGIFLMIIAKNVPYAAYRKLVYPILLLTVLLLAAVLGPHIGHRVGGARRWLRLAGFSLQPGEFAKLTLVMYTAYSLAKKEGRLQEFSIGLLPHLLVCGVFTGLVLLQPDLGTAVMYVALVFVVMFVAGVPCRYLGATVALLTPMLALAVFRVSYRWERLLAFLDPWRDPSDTSFQLLHSLQALGSGGIFGVGLGAGKQKLFFLPEPHTDFILAVIGEEAGLVGVGILVFLYVALVCRGIQISLRAPDRHGTYLAFGLTMIIGLQALINGAVVTGMLPTKGLPLPFVSYGGSALVTNILAVGILLNISSQGNVARLTQPN